MSDSPSSTCTALRRQGGLGAGAHVPQCFINPPGMLDKLHRQPAGLYLDGSEASALAVSGFDSAAWPALAGRLAGAAPAMLLRQQALVMAVAASGITNKHRRPAKAEAVSFTPACGLCFFHFLCTFRTDQWLGTL